MCLKAFFHVLLLFCGAWAYECLFLKQNGEVKNDTPFLSCKDGVYDRMKLCMHPNDRTLYVVGTADGFQDILICDIVAWFNRDVENGSLSLSGIYVDSKLSGFSSVSLSPDCRFLYVTSELRHSVSWFKVDPKSDSLSEPNTISGGMDGIRGLTSPQWLLQHPQGKYVFVYGKDSLSWYLRDSLTGRLLFDGCLVGNADSLQGISGYTCAVISEDGTSLYVASDTRNALSRFYWQSNHLVHSTTIHGYIDTIQLNGPCGLALDKTGRWLYVSLLLGNSIIWFDCLSAVPGLAMGGILSKPADIPLSNFWASVVLAVSPDGKAMYTGTIRSGQLSAYSIDIESGTPTFCSMVEPVSQYESPTSKFSSITTSFDGRHVYAAVYNGIYVFGVSLPQNRIEQLRISRGNLPINTAGGRFFNLQGCRMDDKIRIEIRNRIPGIHLTIDPNTRRPFMKVTAP